MRTRLGLLIAVVLLTLVPHARAADTLACYSGSSQLGGQRVTVNGIQSSQFVQQSFPLASTTVFIHGTTNLATIFTDATGSFPLPNPFTATSTASAFWCAANGTYDVTYSGGAITTPITIPSIILCFNCSGGGGGGGGTVTTFTSGNLTPLFTTSVATPTTTPSLTFTLTNANPHQFFGNNTGSIGPPSFVTLGTGDLPFTYSGNTTKLVTGGTISGTGATLCTDASGNATTTGCSANAVASVFGRTGVVTAQTGDYAVGQVTGAAPLSSPTFIGTPTTPTQSLSDSSAQIVNSGWVKGQGYLTPGTAVSSFNSRVGAVTLLTSDAPLTAFSTVASARTTAITTTTALTPAANSTYLLVATAYCNGTVSTATVTPTFTYTDVSNTSQTILASGAANCTTLGPASQATVEIPVRVKAGTPIQYAVAIANAPTYDFTFQIYQLTVN